MQPATCPVSQKEASSQPTYRPRRPRRFPLYQLLEDHFEDFLLCYEERFRNRYGPLRSEITRRTVYKFLDCGLLEHGFARVVCPRCKAEFLVGFSCKTRFCPSCHAKKLTLWSDRLVRELLTPVPHRLSAVLAQAGMFTLTVPKRIRPFFLWDRKFLGTLARCAADTIRQVYHHVLHEPRGTPGMVISIQTLGNQAANYNPLCCAPVTGAVAIRLPSPVTSHNVCPLPEVIEPLDEHGVKFPGFE